MSVNNTGQEEFKVEIFNHTDHVYKESFATLDTVRQIVIKLVGETSEKPPKSAAGKIEQETVNILLENIVCNLREITSLVKRL